ncbi:MAG TPA: Gfo/Idh/MocA family oxidoreductase [Cytophagales bacterium]|nr:Gfo/Idh/MocA family oxidoreductase [Cytophagales bacterium]
MKTFALIGAAGFIAPRHMKAIQETGNDLVAAMDKFDSVGVMDNYFPNADFFTEFERFDRHLDKLRRRGRNIDYVSVCSPNYLHDSHIRFGLRHHADVICEKPLVLNPWNVEALMEIEQETGKKIYNILQLRLHPAIIELRDKVATAPKSKVYDVDLTYITSRGHWYFISWKGDLSKSGGIATNIGIHFYDMLQWVFGPIKGNVIHKHEADYASGLLEFERARVRWFLSVNYNFVPDIIKASGKRTFRSMIIDGQEVEFSDGFTELHTRSYEKILAGEGFGILEAMPSVQIVHDIRHAQPIGMQGDYHPLLKHTQE